MEPAIERQTMAKVYLRLLPFCFVLYFICYLDRVNIGFAALTMNKEIGLERLCLRAWRRSLLLGLFPPGGAEQPDPRKGRRAPLDRPHHDQLGHGFG